MKSAGSAASILAIGEGTMSNIALTSYDFRQLRFMRRQAAEALRQIDIALSRTDDPHEVSARCSCAAWDAKWVVKVGRLTEERIRSRAKSDA